MTELGGRAAAAEPVIALDPSLGPQAYRLRADADGIRITGGDDAGVFYGRATLTQLRRIGLPAVEIDDAPDVLIRGVMLDVSRDKVPTLDTLKATVDRLASWKMNEVQLYTEHTFAHTNHREVWEDASPYTREDMVDLDAYCRERHVTLTPNRNCLGHMERWLRHDRYRHLGIPDSFTDPFGRAHPPMTLDPSNPGAFELVAELVAELVDCFTSPRVHVGLDEPYGLGEERLGEYMTHLRALRGVLALVGRDMLVWGEVLYHHPDLLAEVPDGVTLCVWGYEAGFDFARYVDRLTEAGLGCWVCPGTSTWLGPPGRLHNALANIRAGAEAARGADGFMVCDWGDYGHLQYPPVSEPPLAYAAATSWCLEANRDLDLPAALDVHAFGDEAGELGEAVCALGDVYRLVSPYTPNMNVLTLHLYYPEIQLGRHYEGPFTSEGLTDADLATVIDRLEGIVDAVGRSRPQRPDGESIKAELRAACDLTALLCRDARARLRGDGTLASVPENVRAELARELGPLIDRHRELWLDRNRPGGLRDSTSRLEVYLHALRSTR